MRKTISRQEISLTTLPLLWLILFFLIPTLVVVAIAFKPADTYGNILSGWTLETFRHLLSPGYLIILWRTLWISLLSTAICLAIAIPVGYTIARAKPRWQKLLLLSVVIPFWSSLIVRIFAWKSLLHPEGLLKNWLVNLHLVSEDAVLLYHSWTVILVAVDSLLPFAILPIYSAAAKFNYQLIEAAQDLGLSKLRAFMKIFIPSIKQGILTAAMMVFIPIFGAYIIPDMVGGPASEMLGNKIVQKTFMERNIPEASGLTLVLIAALLIPLLIICLIQARMVKSEVALRGIE